MPEGPNFRRAYFECRFGQLHCRNAFPSTGGFDERVALVCIHDAPGSSVALEGLLPDFGSDRSVYAPDLPGCGASDPPPSPIPLAEYAACAADLIRSLRLREVDVVGVGVGAAIAAELSLAVPAQLRRVALVCLPAGEADAPLRVLGAPLSPSADGAHLAEGWRRLATTAPTLGPELQTLRLAAWLGAGAAGSWPLAALRDWRAAERLAQVRTPALVLSGAPSPGRPSPPRARSVVVPDLAATPFLAPDSRAARELRRFLDT
jgi:pimeloyl-ACP methyl ester carboxylesterase